MNKPLICIIDDDRGHSLAMSAFLNAEGFSVHTFPCAEKFLEQKIAPQAYDLLISDINMPGMSGIELCRLLRGGIGFDKFSQYSVIGTVTNFASRLCHMAVEGQILVSRRFLARLPEGFCEAIGIGEATLKGISKTVQMFNIAKLNAAAVSETKRGA